MDVTSEGRRYRLGVLEGDGIGPEIVPASVRIADAALEASGSAPVEWVTLPLGASAIEEHGTPTPPSTHRPRDRSREHGGLLRRPQHLRGDGRVHALPRRGHRDGHVTCPAVERIARVAFDLARRRRGHVTIVHKANLLRLATGLFRDVCRDVGAGYPEVTVDDFHIDASTVHLVRRAPDFDVIVTENTFGDILSDLAGEIAGSLGIAPSLNASHDAAMAQAAHGSAPDIAGRGLANPIAMILSSGMLLDWLGTRSGDERVADAAVRVEDGVRAAVQGGVSTRDLGGTASTDEFTDEVVRRIGSAESAGPARTSSLTT